MQGGGDGWSDAVGGGDGWSDAVENLVDRGDVEGAIAVLESVVSKLETLDPPPPPGNLRLASALGDLADLHSSRGFSLKADALRSRALLIRSRAVGTPTGRDFEPTEVKVTEQEETRTSNSSTNQGEDEDDWEAIADRVASGDVLLPSQHEAGAPSRPSRENTVLEFPKRRGRGSFLYRKSCLYSDQPDVGTTPNETSGSENEAEARGHQPDDEATGVRNSRFATSHVLVLYDFPPSTRTMELEKLFENFSDRGVAIRWVNDTVALAVFRTPSVALEAQNIVRSPFKVRALGEDDVLLTQLSNKDLEPPYPRPKTSARTAQRLIAHGMGMKPSTDFGSNELRKQEEARKNRILARQIMKDEAWGGSDKP